MADPVEPSSLKVKVDGVFLPEAEARALWARFSAHMETNRGDLLGFAKAEGFASIQPAVEGGRPLLVASRSTPQGPYVSVTSSEGSKGGSPKCQSSKKKAKKRH